MNLTQLYSTQLRVLWEWRGGRRALLKRLLITLVVSAVAFWVTAWLPPNITVDRFLDGVLVVILMALLNAIIRPVVLAFVAPRSLILTGIAVLVLQVLVFLSPPTWSPASTSAGSSPALIGSFVYADHQHGPDGHPRHRQRRLLLRPAHPEPAAQARGRTRRTSPASSSSRSTASPTRSSPAGCAPAPSTRWPAGSATAATSCRAGRRSCRR